MPTLKTCANQHRHHHLKWSARTAHTREIYPFFSHRKQLVLFHLAMTSFKGPPGITLTWLYFICHFMTEMGHFLCACSKIPRMNGVLFSLLCLATMPCSAYFSAKQIPDANRNFFFQHSEHFVPPDPSRPCRHAFRNDPETNALLADFVIEGVPIPTFKTQPGPLYNASIHVRQVAKRPAYSIFPVRKGFPILAGPFSKHNDLGMCQKNIQYGKRYIFFIQRPNWAGFFRITQIPLLYNLKRWQKVQSMLKRGDSPLQMLPLRHAERLRVAEGNELILTCRVKGRPAPLISWYVNSTRQLGLLDVTTGRGVIHDHRRSSKLQISNIQLTDSGNYSCLAENINGFIRKTVFIIVSPKSVTTSVPPTQNTEQISVHPCYQYCLHGVCSLIDGRPSCSCISPYRGSRCDYFQSKVDPVTLDANKELNSDCNMSNESIFGRLVLFSTFGALVSLLILLVLCLFVKKRKKRLLLRDRSALMVSQKHKRTNPKAVVNSSAFPHPDSSKSLCNPDTVFRSYLKRPECKSPTSDEPIKACILPAQQQPVGPNTASNTSVKEAARKLSCQLTSDQGNLLPNLRRKLYNQHADISGLHLLGNCSQSLNENIAFPQTRRDGYMCSPTTHLLDKSFLPSINHEDKWLPGGHSKAPLPSSANTQTEALHGAQQTVDNCYADAPNIAIQRPTNSKPRNQWDDQLVFKKIVSLSGNKISPKELFLASSLDAITEQSTTPLSHHLCDDEKTHSDQLFMRSGLKYVAPSQVTNSIFQELDLSKNKQFLGADVENQPSTSRS